MFTGGGGKVPVEAIVVSVSLEGAMKPGRGSHGGRERCLARVAVCGSNVRYHAMHTIQWLVILTT